MPGSGASAVAPSRDVTSLEDRMNGWKVGLIPVVALAVALATAGADCGGPGDDPDAGDAAPERTCQHDGYNGPESAGDLAPGAVGNERTASGWVCPIEDRDWYRLSVPEGDHILNVTLAIRGPLSPVQPTYAVYECDEACVADPPADGTPACCAARVAPLPAEVGQAADTGRPLQVTHCIGPGDYYIVVRDQNDDNQDGNNPRGEYALTVSTAPDPDPAEPNDRPEDAVGLTSSGSRIWTASGQISCRGDQDWYVLDASTGILVGETDLLQVHLTAPVAGYQPQYRVIGPDDVVIATATNEASPAEATDLTGLYWLASGGRYYVVVEDDDGGQADPGATYQLSVTLVADPDTNEPNNDPTQATVIGGLGCTGSASEASRTATISATNDVDVYRIDPPAACGVAPGGVLDVEVTFDGARPEGLEPSVRIVRRHPETPCSDHTGCRSLPSMTCEPDLEEDPDGLECAGFGNSCLGDGVCAGASLCLPGGSCGATVIERHPDFCGTSGHCHGPSGAMRNRECEVHTDCAQQGAIHTAIPLGRNPQPTTLSALDQVYVIVQDFQSNASAPGSMYTIRFRMRLDPDTNEPNEVYSPVLSQDSEDREFDGIPTLSWGSCAVGYLSYERDVDYFRVPHPCPGAPPGCDVHIRYDVGAGPVDVLAGTGFWEDIVEIGVRPDDDLASQPRRSGDFGGPGECVPANPRFRDPMLLGIRDLDIDRDFSMDQRYEICLVGSAPCTTWGCFIGFEGNCWTDPA